MKLQQSKKLCLFFLAGTILFLVRCKSKPNFPETLPVYEIATNIRPNSLISHLSSSARFSPSHLVNDQGEISFEDTATNLRIPTKTLSGPAASNLLKSNALNRVTASHIRLQAIDFNALTKIIVPDSNKVLQLSTQILSGTDFGIVRVKGIIRHSNFSANYKDSSGKSYSISRNIDTRVDYQFADPQGYPFTGPGARLNIAYTGNGRLSSLAYSWRGLKVGRQIKLISEEEARERVSRLLPAGADIILKIVYWCPALSGPTKATAPHFIIPWYSFTGKINGYTTKEGLLPATDDPAFAPSVTIKVSIDGNNQIAAVATVTGGQAPYRYTWLVSNDSVSRFDNSSIHYRARARTLNNAKYKTERIGLIVRDANGVIVRTTDSIKVIPDIDHIYHYDFGQETPTYGCESPAEPDEFGEERVGWQQGMSNAGGGTQLFCRTGDDSWPGDYIKPNPAGSLSADPWINGNADYSNWGINTASIVLINGDGFPDNFTAMYPNAPASDYLNVLLYRPTNRLYTELLPLPSPDENQHNVPYAGSWGPIGPNDHLYWLCGMLCNTLGPRDAAGLSPQLRWGPAFGGLHIFTGFTTQANFSDGNFPRLFAENMLGVYGPPQTIVRAWFNAARTTGVGTAAAMGPIGANNTSDLEDYYFGKGSQGPTITPDIITGWWYYTIDNYQ